MPTKSQLVILGSTGSIGTQALDVCRHHPERFEILALAGGTRLDVLISQIQEFTPPYVSVATDVLRQSLIDALQAQGIPLPASILTTESGGLSQLATLTEATDVLVGVVGILGLTPSLAALEAGKRVLTANKETFVAGGHLVQPYLKQVIPFDSEHSALFQSLNHASTNAIKRLWITASGGPFLGYSLAQLAEVTQAQALKHPKWTMGAKVTIDSATLMNKGLELIEARWLFDVDPTQVDVLVHPQSVVHGMVEFIDGSVMAQLAPTDMRIPIQVAMSWPERWHGAYMQTHLDLKTLSQLTFLPPDEETFRCLALARQALQSGSKSTTILNAVDEVVVQAFLEERLRFVDIPAVIERVLEKGTTLGGFSEFPSLEEILHLDAWAREEVKAHL
jgi:1-deoxy-D-xylulose-5-phosphate reductoisomerase